MRERAAKTTGKKVRQFVRGKKRPNSPFDGLWAIAAHLNGLPDLGVEAPGRDYPLALHESFTAWTLAKSIVSASSLVQAGKTFTDYAAQHPVNMYVEVTEETPRTAFSSRDEIGTALWHLWLFYFRDHGWERLKPCPICHIWFVDTSKNRSTARCSSACTWKWWSRSRRKQAHAVTKGVKSHGLKKHRQEDKRR